MLFLLFFLGNNEFTKIIVILFFIDIIKLYNLEFIHFYANCNRFLHKFKKILNYNFLPFFNPKSTIEGVE
jgi:hypothetical protein